MHNDENYLKTIIPLAIFVSSFLSKLFLLLIMDFV